MARLPTGTVTFLFTDIESSTALLQQLGPRYVTLLADHHRLLRAAFDAHGGEERETQGDGLFFTFPSARAALLAAVGAQRAVAEHPWPDHIAVRVRMGMHTGEPLSGETGYVGLDLHRAARICAAGWGAQILISQTTRDLLQDDALDGGTLRDLGEHRLKDLARPERLFQVTVPGLPSEFPTLRSLDNFPHNLPIQLTSFVGREREMAEVRRLLGTTRLLTLTGVGGCGKTRLALQVAADVVEHYPQGAWLVELAALADPALVPQSVASVLAVREERDRPLLETLAEYVRERVLLLLLDNCEHVLSACARFADALLRRCPKVRILATSREGLAVPGEVLLPVQSLSVPDVSAAPTADSVLGSEAVRLFLDRAVARQPAFAFNAHNAGAIAQVCQRLDGIPLAIELAVARLPALHVEQLAGRLDDRFRLLTGGSRMALPRHQTLQALIDWSYDLLSEGERILFRRLSVLVGGWTLEAAEAICAGDGVAQPEVLDLLTGLVNKSLVLPDEQSGEARYSYLETIRQYARGRLLESGDGDETRARHLAFFLQSAQTFDAKFRTGEQLAWVHRMDADYDNMRAALEWARSGGDADLGLSLASALFRYWHLHGYWTEGLSWLQGFLSMVAPARTATRAKALRALATIARERGEVPTAGALFEESRGIYQELGDQHGVVDVLLGMGWIPRTQGDLAAWRAICEESMALSGAIGYGWGIAESLHMLGHLEHSRGEYRKALVLFEESVAGFRAMDNRWSLAHPLTDLGREALRRGDYARARAVLEESLTVFQDFGGKAGIAMVHADLGEIALAEGSFAHARECLDKSLEVYRELGRKGGTFIDTLNALADLTSQTGDYRSARAFAQDALEMSQQLKSRSGIAESSFALGLVAYREGDARQAAQHLTASLRSFRESGEKVKIARNLQALACLAARQGHSERAVGLFAASEVMTETVGAHVRACDRPELDRVFSGTRAALSEDAFSAALAKGQAMTLEQAVEYALTDDVPKVHE